MLLKRVLVFAAVVLFGALSSPQQVPTVKSALVDHWNDRGCNCDWWAVVPPPSLGPTCPPPTLSGPGVVAYSVVTGGSWSPRILTNGAGCAGHTHGSVGALVYRVRTSCLAGFCAPSSFGGNLTEFLCSGTLLAAISGTHNGVVGGIPAQAIPNNASLVCLTWCCQATVAGGGFVDLSSALYGIIGDTQ